MVTTRIGTRFDSLAASRRTALITYIMAGDPHPDTTVPLMHTLVQSGSDLIELGVPFSDPMADGAVIQAASARALCHRVGLREVIGMVAEFRESDADTPVVLMSYQNPIEAIGEISFVKQAVAAGVDGVLVVDLPIEEAGVLLKATENAAVDVIFLVSPTTSAKRLARIAQAAHGFIYYVSLKGVTGAHHIDLEHVAIKIEQLKSSVTQPIAVGFGIHDAHSASEIARLADAIVVGSAIVSIVERRAAADCRQQVADFVAGLRVAIDTGNAA